MNSRCNVWIFRLLILIFIVSSVFSFVFAQETNTNGGFLDRFYKQEEEGGRSFWWVIVDILNILLTLAIVIAIVYVSLRFLKKATGSPVDDFGVIEIMASKGISQGVAIYIIRIGKDYYVMSSGERGLNLITKIEDKELVNILNLEKSKQASSVKEDFLDTIVSLFKKKKEDTKTTDDRISFIKNQKDRIKNWE
ncbi:MAG: hypothetical protein N2712_02485 [Brevinematales bacterium]|nr:hypothetical protein [Brevinematales bacterium]